MDVLKLQKKGIFVPTPGQAEQEYLAAHLHKEYLAYTIQQSHFSLSGALQAAREFPYKQPVLSMEDYKTIIQQLTADCCR